MTPAYRNGDFVLVSHLPFLWYGIRPGDVIVFRQKGYGTLLKEVKMIKDEEIYAAGLHPNSMDSRNFGWIKTTDVIGRVIFKIRSPNSKTAINEGV